MIFTILGPLALLFAACFVLAIAYAIVAELVVGIIRIVRKVVDR